MLKKRLARASELAGECTNRHKPDPLLSSANVRIPCLRAWASLPDTRTGGNSGSAGWIDHKRPSAYPLLLFIPRHEKGLGILKPQTSRTNIMTLEYESYSNPGVPTVLGVGSEYFASGSLIVIVPKDIPASTSWFPNS